MGIVSRYLEEDHARIDDALRRATRLEGEIEPAAYAEFRGMLLRHIGMEEKILLPAARTANGGKPILPAARLHLDHAALAALLVPTPTEKIVEAVRAILRDHNALEEGPGGAYAQCERLPGFDAAAMLVRLQAAPKVALAPHVDSAIAMDSIRVALQRAGYRFEL